MGGTSVIPETAFNGAWLANPSERFRYRKAFAFEQERLSAATDLRTKGVVVAAEDSVLFCAQLFAALAEALPVWLRSASPGRDDELRFADIHDQYGVSPSGSLFIPTGGTSGGLRFARHSWGSVQAAADGLQHRFAADALRSWCCLPMRHVAGLMQVVRAVVSGGDVHFGEYRDLAEESFPRKFIENRLVSLVPTQLARLLSSPVAIANLRSATAVFVGGGPMQADMRSRARELDLPVAPTYGTTETAGMVTLLSPELFLAGREGVGTPMPGTELSFDERGILQIRSESLCSGYHDRDFVKNTWFQTADFGFLDKHGSLRIEGRLDRLVNTGGVKVDPAKVEQAILDTGLVEKCFVAGMPDPEWGECLVAFCVPVSVSPDAVQVALTARLARSQVPKILLPMDRLPLDELGKPDTDAMIAAVAER